MKDLSDYVAQRHVRVEITDGPNMDVEIMADGRTWEHYVYTLRIFLRSPRGQERQMDLPWKQGLGITADPSPETVLDCLVSDSWGWMQAEGFADWAGEYGFDSDSVRALRTWEAVERNAKAFIEFLGGEAELERLAQDYERL